jgi:dTDP-4-dehydrorhamnose reductase
MKLKISLSRRWFMSGKKVVITGAGGMLGKILSQQLQKSYQIFPFSRDELDITNFSQVKSRLSQIEPDIIIHTAAFTNTEKCEEEVDSTYSVNAVGTGNIVNWAVGKDTLFIYISSTGVYGEERDMERYTEFDTPNPTSIHHKTKYEGEKLVEAHLQKYLIVRTGWLFGGDREDRKNFVYKRYLEALNSRVVSSDISQIGNPTSIENLSKQIELLIRERVYGVFNVVDTAERVTRYHYIGEIIKQFGLETEMEPSIYFQRVAKVSKNESARNYKLELMGLNIMEDWRVSLERYINKLKKEIE